MQRNRRAATHIDGAGRRLSQAVAEQCRTFLGPWLRQLDARLDRRLVRTAQAAVGAIVRHRQRAQALLLSELGAYLTGPRHAPAGTKRLANLVHSPRWTADLIDTYLLEQAATFVGTAAAAVPEGRVLCLLDDSVLEKPESGHGDGLGPVRSSKARRLARPRPKQPGYWHGRPAAPVVVPGLGWQAAVLAEWAAPTAHRPLALAAWHWAPAPVRGWDQHRQVLTAVVGACGAERLLHVWDRGLSGRPWLHAALDQQWHFVVRWPKRYRLRPAHAPSVGAPAADQAQRRQDARPAWRLTAGARRAWGTRLVPNPRQPAAPLQVAYYAVPVRLVERDEPLWLVVARLRAARRRRGGSTEPWRLLTTEPVTTPEQCWRIVEAYAARWQIEQTLRFAKSELGIESVRVRAWEARRKLLGLVSLAYAFLVHLLSPAQVAGAATTPLAAILTWAHRTGRQARTAWQPLYRLRLAVAALWTSYTPNLHALSP